MRGEANLIAEPTHRSDEPKQVPVEPY